jgi:hypothetical protein
MPQRKEADTSERLDPVLVQPRSCEICGVDISDTYRNVKRCRPCAADIRRRTSRDWSRNAKGSIPSETIVCKKCGEEAEREFPYQRYCAHCSPYRKDKQRRCVNCEDLVPPFCIRCSGCQRAHRNDLQRERRERTARYINCARCDQKIRARSWNHKLCGPCAEAVQRENRRVTYWADPAGHAKRATAWHQAKLANDPVYKERIYDAVRARKNSLEPATSETIEYRAILRNDPCSYCGGPGETIDHITPISAGGSNQWENLTSACKSCNASKCDRSDWLIWLSQRLQYLKATQEWQLGA